MNGSSPGAAILLEQSLSIGRTPRLVLRSAGDGVVMRAEDRQQRDACGMEGSP